MRSQQSMTAEGEENEMIEVNDKIETVSITDLSLSCDVYESESYIFFLFLRLCSKLERFTVPNIYSYRGLRIADILAMGDIHIRRLDVRVMYNPPIEYCRSDQCLQSTQVV